MTRSRSSCRLDRVANRHAPRIGADIVALQQLALTVMDPPPVWARKWQTEAEHVLFLAHMARDAGDVDQLSRLDAEARRLIDLRTERLAKRRK